MTSAVIIALALVVAAAAYVSGTLLPILARSYGRMVRSHLRERVTRPVDGECGLFGCHLEAQDDGYCSAAHQLDAEWQAAL